MSLGRLRLRNWIELARIRRKIAEKGTDVSRLIFDALSLSSDKPDEDAPWYETAESFDLLLSLNDVRVAFPILRSDPSQKKQAVPWEYDQRDWYFWLHLFASHYGWSIDTVSELDIDDAFGLLQEIRVVEQLEKEWEHSLSEISYPYNEKTKKQYYKPLKRPSWMGQGDFQAGNLKIQPDRKVKMPKRFIPPGIIIRASIDENENPEPEASA